MKMNRSAYWSAYRNVCMAVECWHAGVDCCDTLSQYLAKIAASFTSNPTVRAARINAVAVYRAHICQYGSAPHNCWEVAEGQPCKWHPTGAQVR
jgi:hypothetical protein